MKKLIRALLTALLSVSLAGTSFAQTSAGAFLKIDASARVAGMAGTFCGIADDANSILFNPAGVISAGRNEVLLTHTTWIEGVTSEFAAAAIPLGEFWSLGLAGHMVSVNGLIERDTYGNDTGKNFGGSFKAGTLTIANELGENIYGGLSLKNVSETVDIRTGSAMAGDLGFLYNMTELQIGVSVMNIGSKLKLYEEAFPLPSRVVIGMSHKPVKSVVLGLDFYRSFEGSSNIKLGGEFWLLNIVALRAGYRSGKDENTGSGLTVGVGLKVLDFQLDYAMQSFGEFGSSQLATFVFRFGKGRKQIQLEGEKSTSDILMNRFIKASDYYNNGAYESAITELEEILKVAPEDELSKTLLEQSKIKLEFEKRQTEELEQKRIEREYDQDRILNYDSKKVIEEDTLPPPEPVKVKEPVKPKTPAPVKVTPKTQSKPKSQGTKKTPTKAKPKTGTQQKKN